jgi:hypothetical protein
MEVERNLNFGRDGVCMVRWRGRFSLFIPGVTVAAGVLLSSPAAAQPQIQRSSQSSVGFGGGASIDPEQGFVGVFWESPRIGGRFSLRPGIDGGFGNDVRVATINIDFMARFPIGTSGWNFVQGGGPVIAIWKDPDSGASETTAGGSYIIGFSHDGGFFGEFRIGGGNTPNLKMGAGYQLRF